MPNFYFIHQMNLSVKNAEHLQKQIKVVKISKMGEKPVKRNILHVDMDAFYASVERVDRPELAGKPVIVGGGGNRSVVSAASYEARDYGVHSAMPIFKARQLCPDGIYLPVRMQRYKQVSRQIMKILMRYSPLVEQASVDEAYLDITGTANLLGCPKTVAKKIKRNILKKTGLTCSVGIAPNKFLAKIASDLQKPSGLVIIAENEVQKFMRLLPAKKIPGVGAKTLNILQTYGIRTASDILNFSEKFWTDRFGKAGKDFFDHAGGIDHSPVLSGSEPKSFSAEKTFSHDVGDITELKKYLFDQVERVGRELRKRKYMGRTITLKIKFADFKIITRSRTLQVSTFTTGTIFETASSLLDELGINRKIRLVGVGVSNLTRGVRQLALFTDKKDEKQARLDQTIDRIRDAFGKEIIRRGPL
ncbi:DNA polymerase IV [Desulfosarcina sp. BuS5]|uniref:DNA polymerase IV n=2 Tax=Desulfosarcina sp. BuS5 TaxID=933262 RepID=UPI0018DD6B94|nr:DNA polymerase IV [Desulfosarcina sp. BuS5]